MHELYDLGGVAGVIGWDQQTMMPPKGATLRPYHPGDIATIAARAAGRRGGSAS